MSKQSDTSKNQPFQSALRVNKGVDRLPEINQQALKSWKHKKELPTEIYVEGIIAGDRTILSRAITLIESSLEKHSQQAQQILERCMPLSGRSYRIGITGVPGVGKSTFIEAFGMALIEQGHKIAVLAVDPSSSISKGSILGDKTRMENLSVNANAFIRPSPSAGTLGGVARKTREIIILCEAAGFDRILVETVGVGQSETAVHSMVDFFLLLMLAGAGDELQGIKRGIMEMCDGILINKADGDNLIKAQMARMQYQNALHLFPTPQSGFGPKVEICSALLKTGIKDALTMVHNYYQHVTTNGYFDHKRTQQQKYRMYQSIQDYLIDHFNKHPDVLHLNKSVIELLETNQITSFQAAQKLLDAYFNNLKIE